MVGSVCHGCDSRGHAPSQAPHARSNERDGVSFEFVDDWRSFVDELSELELTNLGDPGTVSGCILYGAGQAVQLAPPRVVMFSDTVWTHYEEVDIARGVSVSTCGGAKQ